MKNQAPRVAPFRALHYSTEKIHDLAQVIAPPYDVISPELQRRLYERNPRNVIRLEFGTVSASDSSENNRYTRAAHDFQEMIRKKILVQDSEPSFYLYQQEFAGEGGKRHARRGFFGLKRLEEFGGAVRPHEMTMEGPKRDRLQLMQACHANFSPIFMIYPDPKREIASLLKHFYDQEPLIEIVDHDEVRHRLWQLKDPEIVARVVLKMEEKTLLIADGHHRYEVGLSYQREMSGKNPKAPEDAPFRYILAYFNEMNDPGLVIFPTHRVVLRQPGLDPVRLLGGLRKEFAIESFQSKNRNEFLQALEEAKGKGFGLLISRDQKQHLLVSQKKERPLQVVEVHEILFRKILGITEKEERNPDRVSYLKDAGAVFKAVEESPDSVGILLNPPTTEEVIEATGKGILLPPKSTYFYPKLVTGLVFHWLRPEETAST
ncbi:MAG: DUF1015 domain-containing protein [Deltaproteobacteria bacterium]|nr:DUF1015 domain-containing protein [Deltaproteobacteria bacterium]MBI4373966.1 DUF1015 domain-containing protein [Deltaproteobacteria bacterium]